MVLRIVFLGFLLGGASMVWGGSLPAQSKEELEHELLNAQAHLVLMGTFGPKATYADDWVFVPLDPDPFTDEVHNMALTLRLTRDRRSTMLVVFCSTADVLTASYEWDKFFGGDLDGHVRVQWRVDKNKAHDPSTWQLDDTGEVAFMPSREFSEFDRQARQGIQLVIRVTDPLDNEVKTDTFSLIGYTTTTSLIECGD